VKNKIRVIIILLVCHIAISAMAQSNIPLLEKKISIRAENEKISDVLNIIEIRAGFTFSYNSEIIVGDELTSINAEKKSVREILNQLFKGTIQYKEKNGHVILTKTPQSKDKTSIPSSIKISGYVLDTHSGEKIPYVSIYNTRTLHSVNTDEYGFYSFKIDKPSFPVNLSYNKIRYRDTTVLIASANTQGLLMNVQLIPSEINEPAIPTDIIYYSTITSADSSNLKPIAVNEKLSQKAWVDLNVKDTIYRKWQVSFLPFAGSNHKLSGRVVNENSINILGGVNMGVKKFEFGGLFNINRAYVSKFQFGGLFNYVHGTVNGFQIGGLFNINRKALTGAQFGGLFNIQIGETKGHQVGGLFNIAAKNISGTQIGGLFNIAAQKVGGVQIGGLFNFAADTTGGLQLGGLFNYAHCSVKGAQIGGLFNIAVEDVNGAQIGGLFNIANEVKGVQVAGLINVAKKVNATQIGFINIADSVSGIPVGFLSVARNGYISFELSADESFFANLTFRTGVRKFYNIFTAGLRPEIGKLPLWAAGYGLGTSPRLSKKFFLNIELSSQQLINSEYKNGLKLLNRFYLGADYVFAKRFAVSAGGSINGLLSDFANPEYVQEFSPGKPFFFYEKDYAATELNLKMWWGLRVGVKMLMGKI